MNDSHDDPRTGLTRTVTDEVELPAGLLRITDTIIDPTTGESITVTGTSAEEIDAQLDAHFGVDSDGNT